MRRMLIAVVPVVVILLARDSVEAQMIDNPTADFGPNTVTYENGYAAPGFADCQGTKYRLATNMTARVPLGGLFEDYFDISVGGGVGGSMAVGSGRATAKGGWLQPILYGGFAYDHFIGNKQIQLITPTNNFIIDGADVYAGEIGFGAEITKPAVNGSLIFLGAGLTSRAGGVTVNEDPFPFDPARPFAVPNINYADSGYLGGYRIDTWAGIVLQNGWRAKVLAGIGHDWTDVILNNTHSSVNATISFGLEIPIGPATPQAPWTQNRQPEYIIP